MVVLLAVVVVPGAICLGYGIPADFAGLAFGCPLAPRRDRPRLMSGLEVIVGIAGLSPNGIIPSGLRVYPRPLGNALGIVRPGLNDVSSAMDTGALGRNTAVGPSAPGPLEPLGIGVEVFLGKPGPLQQVEVAGRNQTLVEQVLEFGNLPIGDGLVLDLLTEVIEPLLSVGLLAPPGDPHPPTEIRHHQSGGDIGVDEVGAENALTKHCDPPVPESLNVEVLTVVGQGVSVATEVSLLGDLKQGRPGLHLILRCAGIVKGRPGSSPPSTFSQTTSLTGIAQTRVDLIGGHLGKDVYGSENRVVQGVTRLEGLRFSDHEIPGQEDGRLHRVSPGLVQILLPQPGLAAKGAPSSTLG